MYVSKVSDCNVASTMHSVHHLRLPICSLGFVQVEQIVHNALGGMHGMQGGVGPGSPPGAPPAWMNKVHDQLYRNVHRHTMQPLQSRNLIPMGAQQPQHQALGLPPSQHQDPLLQQMPPQLPWGSLS